MLLNGRNLLYRQNILPGIKPTAFMPNTTITRAQTATTLWKWRGQPLGYPNHNYTDTPTTGTTATALNWTRHTNITPPTTTYNPNTTITRGDYITMLWKTVGSPTTTNTTSYTDITPGTELDNATKWAKTNNITTGATTTNFNPNTPLTRATLTQTLWQTNNHPTPP